MRSNSNGLCVALLVSVYIASIKSLCVPANTCFETQSNAFGTNSLMWTCESGGIVKQTAYEDTATCTSSRFPTTSTINQDGGTGRTGSSLHEGVQTSGSGSGVVYTDYLQGSDCPVRDVPASTCNDYMVFRRYGSSSYMNDAQEGLPYQDIGDNCANKNALYSTFVVPKGCGVVSTGSNDWGCNSTHLWWNHYNDDICQGTFETAQTDVFEINTCGLFREWTHCPELQLSICPEGVGVLDEWYYYFEEICGCNRDCNTVYTPVSSSSSTAQPTTSTTVSGNSGGTTSSTSGSGNSQTTSTSASAGTPTAAGSPTVAGSPTTASPTDANGNTATNRPTMAPTNGAYAYMSIVANVVAFVAVLRL